MNKLKRRIDRACGKRTALHDSIFLDAMLPEFKAANAELLKAIKMNDKSGAIPYTELLEINKAMKENDSDKAGQALKKVQAKLNKAEKALDEEIKTATAKLAESKKAREAALQALKAKKAVAQIFEKAKAACDAAKQSPKSASKLTALTDKIKEYGDLSKRASQIVTMSASGKDISTQIDLLKKSIESAEKKYKKDLAAVEQSAKKSKDELEKIVDGQKIAHGKRDAFQKERLYLANVIKQMPQGDVRQSKEENVSKEKVAKTYKEIEKMLLAQREQIEEAVREYKKFKEIIDGTKKHDNFYFKIMEKLGEARRAEYNKDKSSQEMKSLDGLFDFWGETGDLDKLLSRIAREEEKLPAIKRYFRGIKTYIKNVKSKQGELNRIERQFYKKFGIDLYRVENIIKMPKLSAAILFGHKTVLPRIRGILKNIGQDPDEVISFVRETGRMPIPERG